MNELIKYLNDAGFFPPDVPVDSPKIYRFNREGKGRKRNCWLVAFSNHLVRTGQEYLVCVFGDWSTGEEYSFKSSSVAFSKDDEAVIKKTIAEKRRKAEKERLAFQKEAQLEAIKKFDESFVKGECPYLAKKGLTGGLYGARLYRGSEDRRPCTLVPMRNTSGTLWGIQRIYSDGVKLFLPGQRVDGLFHVIPDADVTKEPYVILCEGFATGIAIHEAIKSIPVVVCFSAANLEKVAIEIKRDNVDCAILICGDSDEAGQEFAEKAAIRCMGKTVFPEFPFGSDGGTDFDDLRQISGIEEVKRQISRVKVNKTYVRCLGHKDGVYYYTSSKNQEIKKLSSHSADKLTEMMPLEYWAAKYQKKDGVDWTAAASDLKDKCHERGIFKHENTRGHGVWLDDNRVVVHLGNRLWVDGRELGIHDIKSQYNYDFIEAKQSVHPEPLELRECQTIVSFLNCLLVDQPYQKFLLGGWIVASQLSGLLPWRPHLFLSAEAGSGKSVLMDQFVRPLLGENVEFVAGEKTTEAGIRRLMRSNALPLLIDEFDLYGNNAAIRADSVLSLIRQASSASGRIVQSATNGSHVEFNARFSAFISAIHNTSESRQADSSRFLQVELKRSTSKTQWEQAKVYLGGITEDYSRRLFSRILSKLSVYNANREAFFDYLGNHKSQRFAQLYSPVLAGWALLVSDEVLTADEIELLASQVRVNEGTQSDHELCLEHLLSQKIRTDHGDRLISALIGSTLEYELEPYGIKSLEGSFVFFHTNNPQIKAFFKGTDFEKSYPMLFKRIKHAQNHVCRFGKQTLWGIKLPLSNDSC